MRVAVLLPGEIDAPRTGRRVPASAGRSTTRNRSPGWAAWLADWDCGSCRYKLHDVT